MINLAPENVRALRTHYQNLSSPLPHQSLIKAVQTVCGIQGQLSPAMLLALRARVNKLTIDDVEKAITDSHSLVRTWAMRGTLHLLAAKDVHWIVDLLGPIFSAKDKHRRLQLGVTEAKSTAPENDLKNCGGVGPFAYWFSFRKRLFSVSRA